MNESLFPLLLFLCACAALTVFICVFLLVKKPFGRHGDLQMACAAVLSCAASVAQIILFIWAIQIYRTPSPAQPVVPLGTTEAKASDPAPTAGPTQGAAMPTETVNASTTLPAEAEPAVPTLAPTAGSTSNPSLWNITWDIMENDEIVESYQRQTPISFGNPEEYFALPGICTFRGNNYRNSATYGTAEVSKGKLSKKHVGFLDNPIWIGCGWTGQPLIVQWDEKTKAIMNLYDKKKEERKPRGGHLCQDGRLYPLL